MSSEHHRSVETALPVEHLRCLTDHLNDEHAEELRVAVAARTGARARHVLAAQLRDLTPRSVELQWVTYQGGHRTVLRFPATATTTEALGHLLRRALHPGLC